MATIESVLDRFDQLQSPEAQLDRAILLLQMPRAFRPSPALVLSERQNAVIDWAQSGGGPGLEELCRVLDKLIDEQRPKRVRIRWRGHRIVGVVAEKAGAAARAIALHIDLVSKFGIGLAIIIALAVFIRWRLIPTSPRPEVVIYGFGQDVADSVTITGKARGIPPDRRIWLVVKSLDGSGRLYPQNDPVVYITRPDQEGWQQWKYEYACIGPRMDGGQEFEIEAVLAIQSAEVELNLGAGENPCTSPVPHLPDGATIYAREKVTRKLSW